MCSIFARSFACCRACQVIGSYVFLLRSCAIPQYVYVRIFSKAIRSYTFLYVPWQPSRNSCKLYLIFIHSYTFCDNLPAILATCILFLYIPIRSVTTPSEFLQNVPYFHTFLYVPWNPLAILAKRPLFLYVPIRSKQIPLRFPNDLETCLQKEPYFYTFLYVPKKFLYAPPVILKNHVNKLYVPLRSNQIPLRPFEKTTIIGKRSDFS